MDRIDFSGLSESLIIRAGASPLSFPTRQDYLDFLLQRGIISRPKDFTTNADLVSQVHADWHVKGAQGCRFAQLMSVNPEAYGWHRIVVSGTTFSGLDDHDLDAIAQPVERAVGDG